MTDWVASLDEEQNEKLAEYLVQYQRTPVPTTAAILAFFGIDPNTVPAYNAFYSDGYVTFRAQVEPSEYVVGGYQDVNPVFHAYPEGLTLELLLSAQKRDNWGL